MLSVFKDYIAETQLFEPSNKILLAISGGVDSVVMAHLFKAAAFKFGMAHCNFQLRGKASNEDVEFVKSLAENLKISFHTIKFSTKEESEKQQISVEMMARDLRYKWFEKLLQEFDYQYVATAHHLNDSLETVLFNLVKGTGIRGLHGIPIKNKHIIRPLSFASRKDILNYALEHKIVYREDASNQDTAIKRNLIRHKVIPPLKEINPSLEQTFSRTLKQLRETEQLFLWAINFHKKEIIREEGNLIKLNIAVLKKAPAKATILFEIIYEYGFNKDHVDQIFRAIDHVGAQFYSKTHHILIERKFILLKRKRNHSPVWLLIEMLPDKIYLPKLQFSATILKEFPANLNQGKLSAFIDIAKIKLPLLIRNWQEGDRFYPLGMKGKSKKIKDYLRDEKISIFEKELILVLETNGKIIWVIGHRADERFKIDENTKEILQLTIQNS